MIPGLPFFSGPTHLSSPRDDAAWAHLVDDARVAMQARHDGHDAAWGLGGMRWEVRMDEGLLRFVDDATGRTADCSMQVVGTVSPEGTWLWGWDHPSVPPALRGAAERVRAHGVEHGLDALTTRLAEATVEDGWDYCAVAGRLTGAQGVYKGTAGETHVFMVHGPARVTEPDGTVRVVALPDLPPYVAPAALPSLPPVVPTKHLPEPRTTGPVAGMPLMSGTPETAGPEPEVRAEQVLRFVQRYFAALRPTYAVDPDRRRRGRTDEEREDRRRLMRLQRTLQERHWRRGDTYFIGGVQGTGSDYDLDAHDEWEAVRIAPRLWQVTWTQHVGGAVRARYGGYVVGVFDDGFWLVDELEEELDLRPRS
ncbi:hypothetical protein INN71_06125 [Nocardioides sp. ChNu-153]|uniref:DUF6882 domain-containing protein n=1 Tax=Nocardioides sp. ChNu-153 TaxID=2779364 RepID=UPI002656075B|nr:DUF6882 domain-containing protein [Nocardioides sp. ChNu-153]MDN7120963.1 hypothetical protein [Nocardioides sp. ChNu-153]